MGVRPSPGASRAERVGGWSPTATSGCCEVVARLRATGDNQRGLEPELETVGRGLPQPTRLAAREPVWQRSRPALALGEHVALGLNEIRGVLLGPGDELRRIASNIVRSTEHRAIVE